MFQKTHLYDLSARQLHWLSLPLVHLHPWRPCQTNVTAFRAGVVCTEKFKRESVPCCPSAEASINMIPIVLASVLIASGENIWLSLILCVIVSACLQVGVCACTLPHNLFIEKKNCVGIKSNTIVLPHEHSLFHVHYIHFYLHLVQPLGAAPQPLSPWLPVWSME